MMQDSHEYFMNLALVEAQKAFDEGEIPVGAIVVAERQILAKAHNYTERLADVTAHAEILAITAAAQAIGAKYLPQCTLYVTLEPCLMCAGAVFWSQLQRIVFGAGDERRGFRQYQLKNENERANSKNIGILHPKTQIIEGILEQECKEIMQNFFRLRRN
jgi:tRNA(adenine34) deaminase